MEAKQVRDLMEAYASVYQEKEEVNEDLQQKVGQALDAAAKNPVIQAIGGAIKPVGQGRKTPTKDGNWRPVVAKENAETDLFDYLLEYLVAEGYADTNKAALAIMANMSEEWKQEIVDACELQEKLKPGTKRVSFSTGRDENHNQAMTERNPRTGRQRGTSPELKAIGAHARARTAQRNAEKSGDTQAAQRHKNRRDKIATVVYNKTNRIIDRADND